jgi:effector-binding domain-containing protein
MPNVTVETVAPRRIAAVRRRVTIGEVGQAWKPALDLVWPFLNARPGLRTDGHNVFIYYHPAKRSAPMQVDFGVEVAQNFDAEGEIVASETPAGEAATAVHVGPYHRMRETHDAIHAYCSQHGRHIAGTSWEVYGDWSDNPAQLKTTIYYLLT